MPLRAVAFLGQTALLTIAFSLVEVFGLMFFYHFKKLRGDWITLFILVPTAVLLLFDGLGSLGGLAYMGYEHFWIPTLIAILINIAAFIAIVKLEQSK